MTSGSYLNLLGTDAPYYSFDLLASMGHENDKLSVFGLATPRDAQYNLVPAEYYYIAHWRKDPKKFEEDGCGETRIFTYKVGRTDLSLQIYPPLYLQWKKDA